MKGLLEQLIIYGLSCLYTTVVLLGVLFKVLTKGRTFLQHKQRSVPPTSLTELDYISHNYIKLKEVKLHYVEAGDKSKPLVLFLHGFPEFWYSWRHQIAHLKTDFWTVAVDMRGYGDSDKPSGVKSYTINKLVGDIEELIQAFGKTSCLLVAHDWGGVIAWYMAMKSPQMIDKLIILNAPHPVTFAQTLHSSWKQFISSWYIFFMQMPLVPEYVFTLNDLELFDRAFKSHNKAKEAFSEQDIEAFKYTFLKSGFTGPVNYYRNLAANLTKTLVDVPKIKMPVLIIWGKDDVALTSQLATSASGMCDNCILKFVDGASHWVQQDSASTVNKYITEFLDGKLVQ